MVSIVVPKNKMHAVNVGVIMIALSSQITFLDHGTLSLIPIIQIMSA